jgi:hypothetical protein
MPPEGLSGSIPSTVAPRPYVAAPGPGTRADGKTMEWSAAMAEARQMRLALVAAERAGPAHARRHRARDAAVRVLRAFLTAAGTALKGGAYR